MDDTQVVEAPCLDHDPNSGPGSDQCMTCGEYAQQAPEPTPEEIAEAQAAADKQLMDLLQAKLSTMALTKPNRATRRMAEKARKAERQKQLAIRPKSKRRKRSRKTGNQATRR